MWSKCVKLFRGGVAIAIIVFFALNAWSCIKYFGKVTDRIEKENTLKSIGETAVSTIAINDDDSLVTIHYFDVGNADATLIQFSDGQTLLIDSGYYETSDVVLEDLSEAGVTQLDAVVVTHQHADHFGAMPEILEEYPVTDFYMPSVPEDLIPTTDAFEILLESLEEEDISAIDPVQGEIILSGDEYSVQVLSDENITSSDLNDYSIVLLVTVGSNSFLFMGDAGPISTNQIIDQGYDVQSDVIRVSHHGSEDSTTQAWLDAVDAKVAIISCDAANNSYGHPHQELLNLLAENELTVFRTDMDGSMTLTCDGKNFSITAADGSGLY